MKHHKSPKLSATFFKLPFKYLVFLLSPEDSTDLPESAPRQPSSRFDSRLHGAVKILFWIGLAMLFWIGLLSLPGC